MKRKAFTLPTRGLVSGGPVRLVAGPLGARQTFMSDWNVVAPGDQIEWTLARMPQHSALFVKTAGS